MPRPKKDKFKDLIQYKDYTILIPKKMIAKDKNNINVI